MNEMSVLLLAMMFGLTSEGLVAHTARQKPYFLSSMADLSGMLVYPRSLVFEA
jgi:hypothetical protein